MGMDMLQARIGRDKIKETEVKSYITDISITPLAIPMICGPGAITNAIVLMEDANSLAKTIILVVSILVIMLSNRDYLLMYLLK
jgi:multiple antibiotic resistance protein